jgi:hypothetical protein
MELTDTRPIWPIEGLAVGFSAADVRTTPPALDAFHGGVVESTSRACSFHPLTLTRPPRRAQAAQ